jgi:hypothetical protein
VKIVKKQKLSIPLLVFVSIYIVGTIVQNVSNYKPNSFENIFIKGNHYIKDIETTAYNMEINVLAPIDGEDATLTLNQIETKIVLDDLATHQFREPFPKMWYSDFELFKETYPFTGVIMHELPEGEHQPYFEYSNGYLVHGGTVYKEVVNEGDLNLFDTISSFLVSDGSFPNEQAKINKGSNTCAPQ